MLDIVVLYTFYAIICIAILAPMPARVILPNINAFSTVALTSLCTIFFHSEFAARNPFD